MRNKMCCKKLGKVWGVKNPFATDENRFTAAPGAGAVNFSVCGYSEGDSRLQFEGMITENPLKRTDFLHLRCILNFFDVKSK